MSDLIKPTMRDIKNQIIADMDERERGDAISGKTDSGGYIILTEHRVIEVYQTAHGIYSQEKSTMGNWKVKDHEEHKS